MLEQARVQEDAVILPIGALEARSVAMSNSRCLFFLNRNDCLGEISIFTDVLIIMLRLKSYEQVKCLGFFQLARLHRPGAAGKLDSSCANSKVLALIRIFHVPKVLKAIATPVA